MTWPMKSFFVGVRVGVSKMPLWRVVSPGEGQNEKFILCWSLPDRNSHFIYRSQHAATNQPTKQPHTQPPRTMEWLSAVDGLAVVFRTGRRALFSHSSVFASPAVTTRIASVACVVKSSLLL